MSARVAAWALGAGLAVAQDAAPVTPARLLLQQARSQATGLRNKLPETLAGIGKDREECERSARERAGKDSKAERAMVAECQRDAREQRRAFVTATRMATAYYESLDESYFAEIERKYGKAMLEEWAKEGLGGGLTTIAVVFEDGTFDILARFQPPRPPRDRRTLEERGVRLDVPTNRGTSALPADFPVPAGFARRVAATIPSDLRIEWNSRPFDPADLQVLGGTSGPAKAGVLNATLHAAELFDGLPYLGDARSVLRHDKSKKLDCTTLTYEVFREVAGSGAEKYRSQVKVGAPLEGWNLDDEVESGALRTRGVVGALTQSGLGVQLSVAEAQPGDFVQYWWKEDGHWQGHSSIISEIRDDAGGRKATLYGAHESVGRVGYRDLDLDRSARTGRIYIGRFRPEVIHDYWVREGLLLQPSPAQLQEWTIGSDRGKK